MNINKYSISFFFSNQGYVQLHVTLLRWMYTHHWQLKFQTADKYINIDKLAILCVGTEINVIVIYSKRNKVHFQLLNFLNFSNWSFQNEASMFESKIPEKQ